MLGAFIIGYGVESGSQSILDSINKKTTVEQGKEAFNLTRKSGIWPQASMMIGLPGETLDTIKETVQFCKDVGVFAIFSVATPIPGTSLYEQALHTNKVKSELGIVANWGDWWENPVVNLTEFTDNQLFDLKRRAEREIFIHMLIKHPGSVFRWLYTDMKVNGFISLLIRLSRGIKRLARLH